MPADSRTFKEYQINKQWASIICMVWLTWGGGGALPVPPPHPIARYGLELTPILTGNMDIKIRKADYNIPVWI